MKLLPPLLSLMRATPLPRGRSPSPAGGVTSADDANPPTPLAYEPDWRSAYQRRRLQDDEAPAAELPPLAVLGEPRAIAPDAVRELRAAAPASATVERIDALRQLTEPAPAGVPAARVWQVELPAPGAAWQLQVEQAQPLAPLTLELRVPPAAQAQARQQLGELDKRLRDAGHDVLRPRLCDERRARRSKPVDGVEP